jgi:HD-like signal output (HDOD) protein
MLNTSHQDLSISDLFKGDLQLASPPNIYFELQKIIESPTKSAVDAAFVIEKDAALTIRLLKLVNSAFYGFPSEIVSIDRAVNLIGTKELQNIVLATVVIDRFSDLPSNLISMHDFWARNLRCALIAQSIDRYLDKQYSDSIFVCGILHNIGQLVFFRKIPELAKEVNLIVLADEESTSFDEIEFEKAIIGFDHYETGAALTKLWKLPDIITESIRLHPYPDNTEHYYKIASILRLADVYSKLDDIFSNDVSNHLDIPISDMSNIINHAYDQFEDIFKIFYP